MNVGHLTRHKSSFLLAIYYDEDYYLNLCVLVLCEFCAQCHFAVSPLGLAALPGLHAPNRCGHLTDEAIQHENANQNFDKQTNEPTKAFHFFTRNNGR